MRFFACPKRNSTAKKYCYLVLGKVNAGQVSCIHGLYLLCSFVRLSVCLDMVLVCLLELVNW